MPPSSMDLCFLTVRATADLLGRRELSPVELTRASLERVEALGDRLNAFVDVFRDEALEQATLAEREIAQGNYRGPFHGIPVAFKDLYAVKGKRTTANSKVLAGWIPDEDATAVARLRDAGAILLGKVVMHEFAIGGPDPTSLFPPARNPWDAAYIPGGSSSGSAVAVATGQCTVALGSDTGGSITQPASYCGVVGLKPTYGLVSRHGVVPLSWSLDHCGPLTRTVEDAAVALEAISGRDPRDPTTAAAPVPHYWEALGGGIRGMSIGLPRFADFDPEATASIAPEVAPAFNEAVATLRRLGAKVEPLEIPHLEHVRPAHMAIMLGEALAYHERNLRTRPHEYGVMFRQRLDMGRMFSAVDYVQAQRMRSLFAKGFARAMQEIDVLVTPATATPAPTFQGFTPMSNVRTPSFSAPFNLAGVPAISVPCGFTSVGLPVGIQIVGKPFDEATVLRVAHAYEQEARWFERRPPL